MTIKNNFAFTVRVCGGNKLSSKDASPMCIEVSPDAPNAAWKVVGDMPHARLMPDSVLLPDGKILYVNGLGYGQAGGNAGQCQYAQRPELATDMYDPETGKWSTLQNAVQRRLYHSGAILLESGHVLTMGSEMDNYDECWPIPKNSCMPFTDLACSSPFNTKLERFAPPYLSQVNDQRIVIKNATASVTHESAFQLDLVDTKNVVRVTFLRYSTTTHSTNTDQRFVELVIVGKTSTSIYVTAPKLMHAPPGNWMVFVLDKDGVPSIAKTVSLQIGAISSIPVPKEAKKNNAVKGAGILGLFGALVMMF